VSSGTVGLVSAGHQHGRADSGSDVGADNAGARELHIRHRNGRADQCAKERLRRSRNVGQPSRRLISVRFGIER